MLNKKLKQHQQKLEIIDRYAQTWNKESKYSHNTLLTDSILAHDSRKLTPGQVAQIITNRAQQKRPFSLIRLGDGEGKLISSNYPELSPNLCDSQSKWWFGRTITRYEKQNLSITLDHAIEHSDLIGIPGIQSICNDIPKQVSSNKIPANPQGRLLLFRRYGDLFNRKLVTSACIHQSLNESGWLINFLQTFKVDGFIGYSKNLAILLKAKHGSDLFKFHQIPGESQLHGKSETDHYPHIFHSICNNISQINTFGIYLVAAGILGKFYCSMIKEFGGMAIDIGSVADDWTQEGRYHLKTNQPIANNATSILKRERVEPHTLSVKPENLARKFLKKGLLIHKNGKKDRESFLMYQNSLLLNASENTLNKRQVLKLISYIIEQSTKSESLFNAYPLLPIINEMLDQYYPPNDDINDIKQMRWSCDLKYINQRLRMLEHQ